MSKMSDMSKIYVSKNAARNEERVSGVQRHLHMHICPQCGLASECTETGECMNHDMLCLACCDVTPGRPKPDVSVRHFKPGKPVKPVKPVCEICNGTGYAYGPPCLNLKITCGRCDGSGREHEGTQT